LKFALGVGLEIGDKAACAGLMEAYVGGCDWSVRMVGNDFSGQFRAEGGSRTRERGTKQSTENGSHWSFPVATPILRVTVRRVAECTVDLVYFGV